MLGTVAEAHSGLGEVAFLLRQKLMPKEPVLKAVPKAELERSIPKTLPQPTGERRLPEACRGGKVFDVERQRRMK